MAAGEPACKSFVLLGKEIQLAGEPGSQESFKGDTACRQRAWLIVLNLIESYRSMSSGYSPGVRAFTVFLLSFLSTLRNECCLIYNLNYLWPNWGKSRQKMPVASYQTTEDIRRWNAL